MPHAGDRNTRGQVWVDAPRGPNIKIESGVKGVWLYPGEYVRWKMEIDQHTKQRFIVGYNIECYGVGSFLEND